MAYGLRVFDSSGNVTFDSLRMTRYVGDYAFSYTSTPVTITVPNIVPNADWIVLVELIPAWSNVDEGLPNAITINTGSVTIDYRGAVAYNGIYPYTLTGYIRVLRF